MKPITSNGSSGSSLTNMATRLMWGRWWCGARGCLRSKPRMCQASPPAVPMTTDKENHILMRPRRPPLKHHQPMRPQYRMHPYPFAYRKDVEATPSTKNEQRASWLRSNELMGCLEGLYQQAIANDCFASSVHRCRVTRERPRPSLQLFRSRP